MNVAVFAWTTMVMSAALMVLELVPRHSLKPTLLDLIFALSIALLVSLLLPA